MFKGKEREDVVCNSALKWYWLACPLSSFLETCLIRHSSSKQHFYIQLLAFNSMCPFTSPSFQLRGSRDLWSVSSLTAFQLTLPRNSFYQSSKVPGIDRTNTAFSHTQWIPQTHRTAVMTKSLNPWWWLMFGLHCCWYCPLPLLSPFKSTHLTKWKQKQKHKQKPPPSSGTHSQTWHSN